MESLGSFAKKVADIAAAKVNPGSEMQNQRHVKYANLVRKNNIEFRKWAVMNDCEEKGAKGKEQKHMEKDVFMKGKLPLLSIEPQFSEIHPAESKINAKATTKCIESTTAVKNIDQSKLKDEDGAKKPFNSKNGAKGNKRKPVTTEQIMKLKVPQPNTNLILTNSENNAKVPQIGNANQPAKNGKKSAAYTGVNLNPTPTKNQKSGYKVNIGKPMRDGKSIRDNFVEYDPTAFYKLQSSRVDRFYNKNLRVTQKNAGESSDVINKDVSIVDQHEGKKHEQKAHIKIRKGETNFVEYEGDNREELIKHENDFKIFLAHINKVGFIDEFNDVKDLHEKIAGCYEDISAKDILFCTVNTHEIEMSSLLSHTVNTYDIIFAHIAGRKKELTLVKQSSLIGLEIADNGIDKSFINLIKENSTASKAKPILQVGDHIAMINGVKMIGKKHAEVANFIKEIPIGEKITMRLVEPLKGGFSFLYEYPIKSPTLHKPNKNQTVRFKADNGIIIQEPPEDLIFNKLNEIVYTYIGIQDNQLAKKIFEIGGKCQTLSQLRREIKKSDIGQFGFPDGLIFELWTVIDDWNNKRVHQK